MPQSSPIYSIIANPTAGRGNGARAGAIVDRIFKRAGVPYEMSETRDRGEAVLLARAAAERGRPVVVAVGGDGTVNEVVNGLAQAGGGANGRLPCTLGIVPLGTGNDFAWRLRLPIDEPARACQQVLEGTRQAIDLGIVTDELGQARIFHNHLGAGLEAAALIESNRIHHLRGLPLYLLAVLRAIPRYRRASQVTVRYEGQTRRLSLLLLAISNGQRTGGGFLIAPQARLDDGLLDLTMATSPNIPTTLWLLTHVMRGTHGAQARYFTLAQAAQVEVEAPAGLPVHVDGEVYRTDARRLEVGVLPQRLEVLVRRPAVPPGAANP